MFCSKKTSEGKKVSQSFFGSFLIFFSLKIVEIAPAVGLKEETRKAILSDALRLMKAANYKNAGTVEFLVDQVRIRAARGGVTGK